MDQLPPTTSNARVDETAHQNEQRRVIEQIEQQVKAQSLDFSTVEPPATDYEADPRLTITSAHLPTQSLKRYVRTQLIEPLRAIDPHHYYYGDDNLHLTIKNVRTIADPPTFTQTDVDIARQVFSRVVPRHTLFHVYYYRLLLFPHNLSLIGTTDSELDALVLDLDTELKKVGLADDKIYLNDRYFFSNVTLVRFFETPSLAFQNKVAELSATIAIEPYLVDSVTLLTCNAVLKKLNLVETFPLRGITISAT